MAGIARPLPRERRTCHSKSVRELSVDKAHHSVDGRGFSGMYVSRYEKTYVLVREMNALGIS
jgi:hypothetical protein